MTFWSILSTNTDGQSRGVSHILHTHTRAHALWWACGTPRRSKVTKGRHTRVPTFSVPESWERETTEYTCDTATHTHMLTHSILHKRERNTYTLWCPGHILTESGWAVMHYWRRDDILILYWSIFSLWPATGGQWWEGRRSLSWYNLQLNDVLQLYLNINS